LIAGKTYFEERKPTVHRIPARLRRTGGDDAFDSDMGGRLR